MQGGRVCVRRILAGLGVSALIAFLACGRAALLRLDTLQDRLEVSRANSLRRRHGFVALASMDGPFPRDAVSRHALVLSGCKSVAGKVGDARRIDLDKNALLRLDVRARLTGNEATFAAWFRPVDTRRKQVLFSQRTHTAGYVLLLEEERLVLRLPARSGETVASCPFAGAPSQMTHVAVTFAPDVAVLFQNGRETCRLRLSAPVNYPRKPLLYGTSRFWPFEGDVDELAVWSRALAPEEVAAVARARRGLAARCEPGRTFALALTRKLSRALSATYRVFDRLVPGRHPPAVMARGIPILMIWPSKRDARHFIEAHETSRRNGWRTGKAADFRGIDVAFDDKIVRLDIALDNCYATDAQPSRMAFLLRDKTRTLLGGSGLARVYPPELHTVLHPDAPYPLPLSGKFVRLYFGNIFKGLYVIEPFDRAGSAWLAYGSHKASDAHTVGFDSSPSACDFPPPGLEVGEAFRRTASLVASDLFFPWSRQELRARAERHAALRRQLAFASPATDPAAGVLKDNVSALYVTGDLNLRGAPRIRWESSDPALVSETGKVTRPENGAPRSVVLTPVVSRLGRQKPIRVRVIPRHPDLQTLFLYIGNPVEKERRVDFSCLRIPVGGGEGEWHTGTAGRGGGLHHRGNSSYVRADKRSMTLKFDEPVAFLEDGLASRHLVLLSGYIDPTRLRNRLSFDAYRAAAGAEGPPTGITSIDWAEVFINNEYFGVWELAQRVRDLFGAEDGALYKLSSREPPIWTAASPENTVPVSPDDARADNAAPLAALYAEVSGLTGPAFAEMARKRFRMEALVNFYLVINYTQNFDGQEANQYLARDAADGRWLIVPWDYDKTFLNKNPLPVSNALLAKLLEHVPEFKAEASEKWRLLRAGPLSDEAELAYLDALAARLAPYMEEEYRLRQPREFKGDYAEAVKRLREVVAARLAIMDERCK